VGTAMIESFYLKEHLGFKEEKLNFCNGLIVFSGPSGSGKSVFFNALLSVFGLDSCEASMLEAFVDEHINLDEFGLQSDDVTIFKCIKQKSMRYFVNSQAVSQKVSKQIAQNFISYLSLRDTSQFENVSLISLIDTLAAKNDALHINRYENYKKHFLKFLDTKEELERIKSEEKKINELKELALFEIGRIEAIKPKVGEDEELLELKRRLSKKEKIIDTINNANVIFESERAVNSALELIGQNSALFDECMNFLKSVFEEERQKLDELEDTDIESILDRIEQISSLKNRFGNIEDILAHLEKRKSELIHYENIAFEKKELESEFDRLSKKTRELAYELAISRQKALKPLEELINGYLQKLYLKPCSLCVKSCEPYILGTEEIGVELDGIDIKKISSGEFNRLRLAFIASSNEIKKGNGILILDEVDSNLSGKESMSVASVLKEISRNYQIFAISHHPQLSSCANQHFLVQKKDDTSFVRELDEDGRIEELSRMISGKDITDKARDFAKSLRRDNK
jgi:DNA repair protein RecN (Recombination protein N)